MHPIDREMNVPQKRSISTVRRTSRSSRRGGAIQTPIKKQFHFHNLISPQGRASRSLERSPIHATRISSRSPSPVPLHATQSTNTSQYTGLQTAVALNAPRATIASIEKNGQSSRPQSASLVQIRGNQKLITNANVQASPSPSPLPTPLHIQHTHSRLSRTQRARNLSTSLLPRASHVQVTDVNVQALPPAPPLPMPPVRRAQSTFPGAQQFHFRNLLKSRRRKTRRNRRSRSRRSRH
jgi:hypothetical protein